MSGPGSSVGGNNAINSILSAVDSSADEGIVAERDTADESAVGKLVVFPIGAVGGSQDNACGGSRYIKTIGKGRALTKREAQDVPIWIDWAICPGGAIGRGNDSFCGGGDVLTLGEDQSAGGTGLGGRRHVFPGVTVGGVENGGEVANSDDGVRALTNAPQSVSSRSIERVPIQAVRGSNNDAPCANGGENPMAVNRGVEGNRRRSGSARLPVIEHRGMDRDRENDGEKE